MDAFRDKTIFEAQASGPIHDVLSELPRYLCSEFLTATHPGFFNREGVRCEDLERLTFPDAFFDLVITQDVLEHVADLGAVCQEIARVLKVGGNHVFTVPVHEGRPSTARARREGGSDVPLLPPVYHGNPLSSAGSLVYTDFGDDLPLLMSPYGLDTSIACASRWYLPEELPWIDNEHAHARYEEARRSGKLLACLRYNSLVFRSVKASPAPLSGANLPVFASHPPLAGNEVPLRLLMEWVLREEPSLETLMLAGEICYWVGELDLAEATFFTALRHAPDSLDALNNLGVVRHARHDLEGAADCFRHALAISPDNAEAAMNLDQCDPGRELPCVSTEDMPPAAHSDATAAQQVSDLVHRLLVRLYEEPVSAGCANAAGELCIGLDHAAQGQRFFSKAWHLAPHDDQILNNLAVAAFQRGEFESAERHLYHALTAKASNQQARGNLSNLYRQVPHLSLRTGTQLVHCPCCGGTFPGFIAGAPTLRPNACCPRCGSLERHRMLWLYLQERTDFFTERLAVLHIAPEKIFQDAFQQLPNLDYVSADLCSPLAMIRMDITDTPFDAATFDVIICSHVLEHVPDDRMAMSELHRVLKPEGWAILQVPIDSGRSTTFEDPSITDPAERKRLFGQDDHVRWYGRDYPDRLTAAGFYVSVEAFGRELPREKALRCGIVQNEDVYHCWKSAPCPHQPRSSTAQQ
jgi:SAM-dependent methyltransferase